MALPVLPTAKGTGDIFDNAHADAIRAYADYWGPQRPHVKCWLTVDSYTIVPSLTQSLQGPTYFAQESYGAEYFPPHDDGGPLNPIRPGWIDIPVDGLYRISMRIRFPPTDGYWRLGFSYDGSATIWIGNADGGSDDENIRASGDLLYPMEEGNSCLFWVWHDDDFNKELALAEWEMTLVSEL